MNQISPMTKRAVGQRLWLAAGLLTAGVAIAGFSLARLQAQDRQQMAQATGTPGQPLQATPSPSPSTAPPAEAKPGGTRPTTPAPEPARPDPQAQTEGAAKAALPPAPAEKMAPPISEKK